MKRPVKRPLSRLEYAGVLMLLAIAIVLALGQIGASLALILER